MKKMMPMMMVFAIIVVSAFYFTWQGISMHNQIPAKENRLHAQQQKYFRLNKAERESVATNAPLTKTLVEIKQAPSDLLRLKLVGVGKILTGIFILLFGILIALIMMPVRLGQMINQK